MRYTVRRLVWNPSAHRLRAPWRLLAASVLLLLCLIVAFAFVVLLFSISGIGQLNLSLDPQVEPFVTTAVGGIITVLVLFSVAHRIDRRQFVDYGLRIDRDWWLDWAFGLALGALLITGIVGIGAAFGWIVVFDIAAFSVPFWATFGLILAVFFVIGIYEEILLRGYVLTNLAEGLQWFEIIDHREAVLGAAGLCAVLFALFHAINPNATLLSMFGITVAGIVLAAGYVLTGELAIPIGLHITWNVFLGLVYGLPVSGLESPVSIVGATTGEPAAVSGGAFGPEAGLLGVAALVVGLFAIVGYVAYRYGTVQLHPAITTPDFWQPKRTRER